jgi:hypothetical protein
MAIVLQAAQRTVLHVGAVIAALDRTHPHFHLGHPIPAQDTSAVAAAAGEIPALAAVGRVGLHQDLL